MGNYSRWDDFKKKHPEPAPEARTGIEHDLGSISSSSMTSASPPG